MSRIFLVIVLVFLVQNSWARVFAFESESVGAFFQSTAGSSLLNQDPYKNSSGVNTAFTEAFTIHPGFELGMVMIPFDGFTTTVSLQAIQSGVVKNTKGKHKDTAVELMTLTSSVFALNAKINFEMDISSTSTSRFYWMVGVGYADITLDQEYSFTTDGKTEYGLSTDGYVEKSNAFALSYVGGLGYEFLAVDNVTMNLEAGYLALPVTDLVYKADFAELIQNPGSASAGDTVLNNVPTKRTFDFGGTYIGIGFRFYINTL